MPLYRIFLYATLVLDMLIITDSFLLPQIKKEDIYKMRSSVYTGGYKTRSYITEYLITQSGYQFQLPGSCYIHRTEGDSITVGVTGLFRRPGSVSWCEQQLCYKTDIRMFTHSYIIMISLWASFGFALFILFFPNLLNNNRRERWLAVAAAFAAMNMVFYWW